MSIDSAPKPENEPFECVECGDDYVMYDGDKVCVACGAMPGPTIDQTEGDHWRQWQNHRRTSDDYEGWHGEDRIKFVGGFLSPWDFTEDELLAN